MERKRPFSTISGGDLSLPIRRWQKYSIVMRSEENESESEEERNDTYDVAVGRELWVVTEEVRGFLPLQTDDDEDEDEDVLALGNNGAVNAAGTPISPFSSTRLTKVKVLLKWITGPAVARNRASLVPPLH